jgi:L-alanine-DL-glutamate epimerase-like enolase superfamily enzyme
MKISKVETIPLAIPFTHGGKPAGWGGKAWTSLSILLVKVTTEDGITGYGEAFSYHCLRAVQAAFEDMVQPIVTGQKVDDIDALLRDAQQKLHLFGRYGIAMFALSGLDIALWDIAAKEANIPLWQLLGERKQGRLPAYASLYRYGEPEIVAERCSQAIAEGYRWIKLHETEDREVAAARQTVGEDFPIMLDTNCPWSVAEARERAASLRQYGLYWLEEPIFPPENFKALAALQDEFNIPIAAGENACTSFEFEKMFEAGAVRYAQPSVTKVGGVTELRKVASQCSVAGIQLMPHSPYFGPGFLATLHLAALEPTGCIVERFYLSPEASIYGEWIDPTGGDFKLPDGPGLGLTPDPDVIREYRVSV